MIRFILTIIGFPFYIFGMFIGLITEAFVQGFYQMAAWLKKL